LLNTTLAPILENSLATYAIGRRFKQIKEGIENILQRMFSFVVVS